MIYTAIIIVNWKQIDLTIQTVKSLQNIKLKPNYKYHIFIIDNHSPDDSFLRLRNHYLYSPSVSVLETTENLGYVGGNNFGIAVALKGKYQYILCANNDIIVEPCFLQYLIDEQQDNHKIIINAPKIYFAPGHEYHFQRYKNNERGKVIWSAGGAIDWNNVYGSNIGIDDVDHGQYDQKYFNQDFLSGCCLLIRASYIRKYRAFNQDYFMYLEDVELCQQAIRQGYLIQYVPASVIWHINSGSSSPSSPLQDYFITRNRLVFGFSYAKIRTKLALLKEGFKMLLMSHNYWKRRAIIDFIIQKKGKGSWH